MFSNEQIAAICATLIGNTTKENFNSLQADRIYEWLIKAKGSEDGKV